MEYGYIRVSTKDQNEERQRIASVYPHWHLKELSAQKAALLGITHQTFLK